jgi:tRNA G18 (ribose-2'-O)-methylase SpoU
VLTPDGDRPIDEVTAPERLALAVGGEDRGVSTRWRDAANARIRIPMVDGVDSLNVGSAAAIALHVLRAG